MFHVAIPPIKNGITPRQREQVSSISVHSLGFLHALRVDIINDTAPHEVLIKSTHLNTHILLEIKGLWRLHALSNE